MFLSFNVKADAKMRDRNLPVTFDPCTDRLYRYLESRALRLPSMVHSHQLAQESRDALPGDSPVVNSPYVLR